MVASVAAASSSAHAAAGRRAKREPASMHAGIRRSRSEPHLRCSRRGGAAGAALTTSRSIGVFPFQFGAAPLRPPPLPDGGGDGSRLLTVAGEPDPEPEMPVVRRPEAHWLDRLLELRSRFHDPTKRHSSGNESFFEDDDAYYVDGDDQDQGHGCGVSYEEDDDEDDRWDRESFGKLLARAPLGEARLFAQLAFLCNMAYVIPEMKVQELKKYYGLRFVTSSLEKKAETGAIRSKVDVDSTQPIAAPACEVASEPQPRRPIRSHLAYEVAASAASYVHARARPALVRRAAAATGGGRTEGPAVQVGGGGVRGRVDGDGGGGRRGRGAAGGRARPAVAAVVPVRVVRLRRGRRAHPLLRHPGLRLARLVAGQPPLRTHQIRGHRRPRAPRHLRGGEGHLRAGDAGDRGAREGVQGARAAAVHGPLARWQSRAAGQPDASGARGGRPGGAATRGHFRRAVRLLRRAARAGGARRRRGPRPVRHDAPRHRAEGLLVPVSRPRHRAAKAAQRRSARPPLPQQSKGAVHADGHDVHPAAGQQGVAAPPIPAGGRGAVPAGPGRPRGPAAEARGGQRPARVPQLAAPARDAERPLGLRLRGRHPP